MTEQEVRTLLTDALVNLFEIEPERIKPETNLYEDLEIDSIDAIDLIDHIKRETGRKLQAEDFRNVRTVEFSDGLANPQGRLKINRNHENIRKTPTAPRQPRLSAPMVLRQGKRRIFLACSGHVCVMADTCRHAANHSPTHYGHYPCRLFCGGTGFQTARLDVLVSRRRQRADACRFRRQPVCQTNRYRTPCPIATPRSAARRRAPHSARYANLVRVLYLQRRNRRHFGRLAILRLVGGLYRHCVVCVNGNLICRRVDLSEIGFEGLIH